MVRNVFKKDGTNLGILQTSFSFSADQNGRITDELVDAVVDPTTVINFFYFKFTFLELAATKIIFVKMFETFTTTLSVRTIAKQDQVIVFSTSLYTHFPPVRPFLPLISAPTVSHHWGLVTRWAQLLITS